MKIPFRTQSFAIALAALAMLVTALPSRAADVQRVVSESGIEAWLIRDHSNPITTMKFAFRGGAALDPDGKEGLANLAASTIDEGAGDMDSTTFQQTLDAKSITLHFDAGLDTFQGTLRSLNKHRADAFDMLRSALTEPRFDDAPVARIRAQIVSNIRQDREDPGSRARRALMETAFAGHPYARDADGTVESVRAVTKQDLRTFAKERFARESLMIGVVGDIRAEDLKVLLDKAFGDLPAKGATWDVPKVSPKLSGGVEVVDMDVAQSAIQFAQPGLMRNDPDFYTAYVLNYIMGGGNFVSRLYGEVREKRGLAYSVYTYLMPLDHAGALMGGAGTANARVAKTIETVRAEWRRFAEEGPTEAELKDAKTYLTGAFPLRFTSSSSIAGMLVGMQADNLGIDYIETRNGYINAVTLEEAKRVANFLFNPGKLSFAVAGRPDGVATTE